jgi:imidazolonepropionase-like amidohydrolase
MSHHSASTTYAPPCLIQGGRLFDGTGAPPLEDAAILLDHGLIQYVGPMAHAPSVGPEVRVIDTSGLTILPGLIDAHAHMLAYAFNLERRLTTHSSLVTFRTMRNLEATLLAGFTTIRDAGGIDAGYRLAVEEGLIAGPRLLVSGQGLAPTGGLFRLSLGLGRPRRPARDDDRRAPVRQRRRERPRGDP